MKAVDFKELAKAVDEWREISTRENAANKTLNKVLEPSMPVEFTSQEMFDEYVAKHILWQEEHSACTEAEKTARCERRRVESDIWDMLCEYLNTGFIVTSHVDGSKFNVYVRLGRQYQQEKIVIINNVEAQDDTQPVW